MIPMKAAIIRHRVFSFGAMLLVCAFAVAANESARLALVIGNAAYEGDAVLKNPVNDSTDVAASLRKAGWQVSLVTNADRRGLIDSVELWGEKLAENPDCSALFYYAGHGMQVDGFNYLLPVRTPFQSLSDIKHDALNLGDVTRVIEAAKVQISLVILDACRDNPFAKTASRSAGGARGLSVVQSGGGKGSVIMFSTSPGEVAFDGTGRNGVFTTALLKNIDADLKLEDMFRKVTAEVRQATGDKQKPWINASLSSDFYLLGEQIRQARAAEAAKAAVAAAQKETEARQIEIDALLAQIKSAEAAKAEVLQKQLEVARRDAETVKAAQVEAAAQAASLATQAAKPKGKVRFESSQAGQIFLGNQLLGSLGPNAPLLADTLPPGPRDFRFETVGAKPESKTILVETAAYQTVFFGKLPEGGSSASTIGILKVVLGGAQEGELVLSSRPLSDAGVTLIPAILSASDAGAYSESLQDQKNFTGDPIAITPGSNAMSPGIWLVSARHREDSQDSWNKVFQIRRATTTTALLPNVAYSIPYQLALLKDSRAALVVPLNTAVQKKNGHTFWGWVFAVPAGFGLSTVAITSLAKPSVLLGNAIIFGIPGALLAWASAANFLAPDTTIALQKRMDSLDAQIKQLSSYAAPEAKK